MESRNTQSIFTQTEFPKANSGKWKSWKLKYSRCWPKWLESFMAFQSAYCTLRPDFIIKLRDCPFKDSPVRQLHIFIARAVILVIIPSNMCSSFIPMSYVLQPHFHSGERSCFNKRITHGSVKASGTSRLINFHLYFSHCRKGSWKCSACSDSTQTALRWQECSRNKI